MLLNCKQGHKNFNEQCLHFNVCQLSLLTFKMVLMTLMLALMKVYFSLLYAQWRIWMPKSVIECWLKCKNRNWIWFMRKCSYFCAIGRGFTQMIAYFLVMNSKRCNTLHRFLRLYNRKIFLYATSHKMTSQVTLDPPKQSRFWEWPPSKMAGPPFIGNKRPAPE